LLTTIGATALGFGLIIGGAPAVSDVFAQEATPPAADVPAQSEQGQRADFETARAQAYDSFVAALASELRSDETAVDAAIRTALTQQVDEREAAGDLDTAAAAVMRAVIDVAETPLFLGFGGRGGMHGFDGHAGRHGFGGRDGDDDRDRVGGLPGDDDARAFLPGTDDASTQSAPAPVAPAESGAIAWSGPRLPDEGRRARGAVSPLRLTTFDMRGSVGSDPPAQSPPRPLPSPPERSDSP
jgi:hypothetical protein